MCMDIAELVSELDKEIARLTQVRTLLSGGETGHGNVVGSVQTRRRGTMSAEGRARIAAAQKKRWAAQKKAAK